MKKIRILIAGYGNVGRGVAAALKRNPDMELAGIISRSPERVAKEVTDVPVLSFDDVAGFLGLKADVAILCGGSKNDLPVQGPRMARYMNTVDSFDNHSKVPEYFHDMDEAAKKGCHVSVISTGWDPGIFSLERTLANAFLPGSRAYGFYGLGPKGGLSMGHSDALRTIPGVVDARQYTVPVPEALEAVGRGENPTLTTRDKHTRECYVVAAEGADKEAIREAIVTMPNYFADYNTTVTFITAEEMARDHAGLPHGGEVIRNGRTGIHGLTSHTIRYSLRLDSNPEFTASALVAFARAVYRMKQRGRTGCITVLDVAPADLSRLSPEELRARML